MIFNITLILIILKLTTCMKVFEEISYEKYCPNNNTCTPPETHIVCRVLAPLSVSRHRQSHLLDKKPKHSRLPIYLRQEKRIQNCMNAVHINLTEMHVKLILENTNVLRAEVASGVARGKDGQLLPKAYGMLRVQWNSELAALSDLMLRDGDFFFGCAATGNFPNPSIASWFSEVDPSLDNFIDNTFRYWEENKNLVTKEHVLKCPDLKRSETKHYLSIIQGAVTHMGCALAECQQLNGISQMKIFCYFSDWTDELTPLYRTDPPAPGSGFTPDCGCPPGSMETDGCLCEEGVPLIVSYPDSQYQRIQITASSAATAAEPYIHIDLTV